MSRTPTMYMNKSSWPADHPFATTKSMGVKDYDWEDTYNFIKMMQDTSQSKVSLVKANLEMVPFPLRSVVQYELRGTSPEGHVKILGWVDEKPSSWNFAMGQLRKTTVVVS